MLLACVVCIAELGLLVEKSRSQKVGSFLQVGNPLAPVLASGIGKGGVSSLVADKKQIGALRHEHIHKFQVWFNGPKRIVKRIASHVIDHIQRNSNLIYQKVNNRKQSFATRQM